jgi:hypothetical protein
MIRLLTVSVFFTCLLSAQAQIDSLTMRYMKAITSLELRGHLEVIASDVFEGRETGKDGQKLAADYLAEQFSLIGLEKPVGYATYFQTFPLFHSYPGGTLIAGKQNELSFGTQFLYTGVDTLYRNESALVFGLSPEFFPVVQHGEVAWILPKSTADLRALFTSMGVLKTKGYSAIVLPITDWDAFIELYGHRFGGSKLRLPTTAWRNYPIVFVNQTCIDASNWSKPTQKWMKKPSASYFQAKNELCALRLVDSVSVLMTENVLGVIPGTDLADEVVVLTAHYDHLGIEDGEIYNGADDNGSGTVALIEIAQSFAMARNNGHGPRRTVLIMPVTGEEKGLLGSKYYTDNPAYSMEQTVANLNIDMIGRTDAYHDSANYVYVIGSNRLSTDLHKVNERAGELYGKVALDYRYNLEDDPNRFYYRSDHYNFVLHNVPSIFYFSGVHEDYHKPTDTLEKIDFQKVEHVTRLVFLTAWMLANQDHRPVVDVKQ